MSSNLAVQRRAPLITSPASLDTQCAEYCIDGLLPGIIPLPHKTSCSYSSTIIRSKHSTLPRPVIPPLSPVSLARHACSEKAEGTPVPLDGGLVHVGPWRITTAEGEPKSPRVRARYDDGVYRRVRARADTACRRWQQYPRSIRRGRAFPSLPLRGVYGMMVDDAGDVFFSATWLGEDVGPFFFC